MIRIAVTAECREALAGKLIIRCETKRRRRLDGSVSETGEDARILLAVEAVSVGDGCIHSGTQPPPIGFRRRKYRP